MDGDGNHGRRSAIVTIKGKPREVDLRGIGRIRVDIIKWRGHKHVEIVVIEEKSDLTRSTSND